MTFLNTLILESKLTWLFLSFSKAFDNVSHRRLSYKLEYYGIQNHTGQWIDCFLSRRSKQVVVQLQEASPAESPVTSGVPHSTILEPYLFLLTMFPPSSLLYNGLHCSPGDNEQTLFSYTGCTQLSRSANIILGISSTLMFYQAE